MGVFTLMVLALFAIESFAGQNIPQTLTNKDNFSLGKKWVVLVAGSSGWYNYRHQADICHAYQLIKKNGIPAENIITMMVDDIADNEMNPTPGKIVNKPNGEDVYNGVVIDYKLHDVNSTNFLKIITGDKKGMQSIGTGKVVEGGPLDTIFINFVDHGSTGMLIFPDGILFADELNDAFISMKRKRTYRKILLYIEACYAGSMFDGILSENLNVLAVTASGPRESSWGCYCQYDSEPYGTCLGDLFSVTWMEDLDTSISRRAARKRSIFNDYREVRTNVTESNVMMYGDFDIGSDRLSSFIGYHDNGHNTPLAEQQSNEDSIKMATSSRNVFKSNIEYKLAQDNLSLPEVLKLSAELRKNKEMRSIIDSILRNIYSEIVKARPDVKSKIGDYDKPNYLTLNLAMFPCYRSVLNQITNSCFSLPQNPYVFDHLTIFANLCVVDNQIHQMISNIIVKSCSNIPKQIINVE